jgi:hypothetical protein
VVDSGALEVTEVSRVIGSLVHVVHADSHIRTHSRSYPTSPRPGLRPLRCAALPADRPFASPRSLASPSWTPQRRYTPLILNCPGTRLYPRESSPCPNTPKCGRHSHYQHQHRRLWYPLILWYRRPLRHDSAGHDCSTDFCARDPPDAFRSGTRGETQSSRSDVAPGPTRAGTSRTGGIGRWGIVVRPRTRANRDRWSVENSGGGSARQGCYSVG